jgi:hypothetical protein
LANQDNPVIEAIVQSVRDALVGVTYAETELTNSGVYRVVKNGKLCGFADTGERTLMIRFVVPSKEKPPVEATRELMAKHPRKMKLVTPDDVDEEIPNTRGFSEFVLRETRNG